MLRNRNGYTLIEIALVLIIAGVLAGLSAGRVAAMTAHQNMDRAVDAVANDLQQAAALANSTQRPVRVLIDAVGMHVDVTDRSVNTTYRHTDLRAAYGMKPGSLQTSTNSIELLPTGLASDTLTIVMNTRGHSRTVRVSRGGQVNVQG